MRSAINWSELLHAYGPATDIPALLRKAHLDIRPGYDPDSTWFALWSALCHQGDVYSASYAAVPELVHIAEMPQYRGRYDPIYLAGSIELARLEGRGPTLPPQLESDYVTAAARGCALAKKSAVEVVAEDDRIAFLGSAAALAGDWTEAKRLLEEPDVLPNNSLERSRDR